MNSRAKSQELVGLTSMTLQPTTPFEGAVFLNPDNEQRLPFSLAVRAGGLLFVSGQAAVDESGNLVPGTFEAEFRLSLENLRRILEAAGSGLDRVVKISSYVRDAEDVPLYNQLYREYFAAPFPARTTITGCLPAALRFELDCVAVVDEARLVNGAGAKGNS